MHVHVHVDGGHGTHEDTQVHTFEVAKAYGNSEINMKYFKCWEFWICSEGETT